MKEAETLRDWLEGKSDGSTLSADIRAAVYVLQPRYAPTPTLDIESLLDHLGGDSSAEQEAVLATQFVMQEAVTGNTLPKGSIHDVLNALEEGPLAPQNEPTQSAEIIPFPKKWVAGLGGLLAVACSLLFVLPLYQPLQEAPVASYAKDEIVERKKQMEEEFEEEIPTSKKRLSKRGTKKSTSKPTPRTVFAEPKCFCFFHGG